MKGKGRKDWCGSRDEQLGVGGWDGLPLQQQSQHKVFIKPQPFASSVSCRTPFFTCSLYMPSSLLQYSQLSCAQIYI